ncbi:transcription termination factor Rho [Bremerella cremea]|uniref:Transcription termination factor Rho n=1 Tax=Bremerella cremea TaxID=1031537 RepID=A0A368KXI3_9BACT|nr:transcription termination factor Rho [Bremerella cremea]RCS56040.1 transcription termination factor Rho [Bremerella cremea]
MSNKRQTRSKSGGRRRGNNSGGSSGPGPKGRGRSGGNRRRSSPPSSNVPRNNLENEEFEPGEPIPLEPCYGLLEMHPNGYGFLRSPANNYARERTDPFVPGTMIERYGLRVGVMIRGMIQHFRRGQGPRLRDIFDVDGMVPENYVNVKSFDDLTPVNPSQYLKLEFDGGPLTNRVVDLLTPLGKGQRALIVAPPRTGKTMLMQNLSRGITANHPNVKLVVLLIDERPEEVTDMQRSVKGEVIASSLDRDVESHVRLSQLVIERCKRLAESGQDVFLLLDSITRLARAFNKWVGDGRGNNATMSGGINVKAMDIPKKLFATARAFEEGGSLTIVGTALVDTGSKMDEVIFQEFKGTGNMELVLDRKLSDRRVWPAIDISQSGTRREELLLDEEALNAVIALRRTLTSMHHIDAMEQLTRQLGRYENNKQFISLIANSRDRYQ